MTNVLLSVVLGVAAVAAALLVGVALAALLRRRSVPYLLVTLALATLLARTLVGVGVMVGGVDDATHHTLEHGLDVVMAGLVIAAVWTARRVRTE
jgi:Na+/serine symporter